MSYKRFTRDTFHLRDRIEGASNRSIILKGDDGEKIFITNKLFNKIMHDPSIEFVVETIPTHESRSTGRFYGESKWISAYLPSRF